MAWTIEEFEFCEKQQTLTKGETVHQLEPMLVALLSYFCQHPNEIISRDQLIEHVWTGRIVSDSAINRAITKLRKLFEDNPRQPKFIATFPKKGYSFVAEVSETTRHQMCEESQPSIAREKQHQPANYHRLFSVVTILVVALVGAFLFWFQNEPDRQYFQKVSPLTRGTAEESFPRISPDLQYMAFVEVQQGKMSLKIKRLSDNTEISFDDDLGDRTWVGPASWSPDGTQIAYLATAQGYCGYYIRSFSNFKLSEPELIHRCPDGSAGKLLFSHDKNTLILAQTADADSPYQLFTLDIPSGQLTRLNQPEPLQGGNSQFDLHPFDNKLLISAVTKEQHESFYELDMDKGELTFLFSLDQYICCGIYNHQGDRVVLMGEHPSKELVSYDFSGNDKQILLYNSKTIYLPDRYPNGKDYLFLTDTSDENVLLYRFDDNSQTTLSDTSADDMLASFSPVDDRIAFISAASDSEQVWIKPSVSEKSRQLTSFSQKLRFVDLVWSNQGKQLALLTRNGLYTVNSESGSYRKLHLDTAVISGVSFKSEQILGMSVKEGQQWQAYNYDLTTDKLVKQQDRQFVNYGSGKQPVLWLDKNEKLYFGEQGLPLDKQLASAMLYRRRFNLRRVDGSWYLLDRGNFQTQLVKMSPENQKKRVLTAVNSFDVKNQQVLFNQNQRRITDIYKTN